MSLNGNNKSGAEPQSGWTIYEFGTFRLDMGQRILLSGGGKISLSPKAFELLVFLLDRSNRVVDKEELMRGVWGDSFVEEANLVVHISNLRKLFSAETDPVVTIETFPKVGYRLNAEVRMHTNGPEAASNGHISALVTTVPGEEMGGAPSAASEAVIGSRGSFIQRHPWKAIGTLVLGVSCVAVGAYLFGARSLNTQSEPGNQKREMYWNRQECPRDSGSTNLEIGGCEDAIGSFSLESNPKGNWAYGYGSKDDISQFILFEKPNHNNLIVSPEAPVDFWTRPDELHPLIMKNTSNVAIVVQGGVIILPSMLEMHPGPNGERSVVRWTAPAAGFYRIQGQFRGTNNGGYTSTDVLVIHNKSTIRFEADVIDFNYEKPFNLTFLMDQGDTVDFSIGYGKNGKFDGDSTGFSAIVTTISLGGNTTMGQ